MPPYNANPSNSLPFIPNMNNPDTLNPSMNNPFIPNMFNPFNAGQNFPFYPQNPFIPNPNQFGGNFPSNDGQNNFEYDSSNTAVKNPSNLPTDSLPTTPSTYDTNANTPTPLDAKTAFDQNIPSTPSVSSGNNQPQNPFLPTVTEGDAILLHMI